MRGRSGVALAAGLVVAVSGCASLNVAPPAAVPVAPGQGSLAGERVAAGIPDCPETDLAAQAVPGGLPAVVLGCLASDRQINLAGLRGSPMVINVWAEWCPPCREEAPALARFAAASKGQVQVLGIDFNDPDTEGALAFAAESQWTYPHAVDPLKQTASQLKLSGIPVTLLVGADGVIVHRIVGAVDDTVLADATEQYLGITVEN